MTMKLLTCCAALIGLLALDHDASAYFWYTTAPRCTTPATCASGLECKEMHDGLKFCLKPCATSSECGGQICHHGGCVTPTRWFRTELTVRVSTTAPQEVDWSTMEGLVHGAYDAWVDLPGCKVPQVDVVGTTPATAITTPTTLSEEPDNIVVFIKDSQRWRDIPGATGTQIALTIIAHNPETGEIADADIAVNDANFVFTTADDATAGVDLLSALTHEAGHFFGLAHSKDADATMAPGYGADVARRIQARDPATDDIDGICALYADVPPHVDSKPPGGGGGDDGCAGAGGGDVGAGLAGSLALLALVALRRRRGEPGVRRA